MMVPDTGCIGLLKDIGRTYVMYARRSKVVFLVENPLNSIAMRAYALEKTLLTWASNVSAATGLLKISPDFVSKKKQKDR